MIRKQPDIELAGEAKEGEELVRLTRLLKPDIIVTDILMPGMNGIEATKIITKEFPNIGVIALSMSNQENLLREMVGAGALGFLLKNAHKDEITEAIKEVHKGHTFYCKNTSTKLIKLLSQGHSIIAGAPDKIKFSEKEVAIIRLICKEFSSQEIADELKHSIRTIDSYRKNILKKIKAKNATGIVMYAIKNKMYDPEENLLQVDKI